MRCLWLAGLIFVMGFCENNFQPFNSPVIETSQLGQGRYLGTGRQIYALSLEQLVSVITDYSNGCQSSRCRYHVPNVEETRILGEPDGHQFYIWTKIKNIKSGSYYSQITIHEDGQQATIRNSMVTQSVALELTRKYGLPHEPLMDTTDAIWTLHEQMGDESNIQQTLAEVKIETSSSNFLINRFPQKVLSGLNETIKALLLNLMP